MPWKTGKPAYLTTATLTAAGLLTAGLAAMSGPAQAQQPPKAQQEVQIMTFVGKCLDVSGPFDGASVIQSRCRDSESQEFRIRYVGDGESEIRTFAGKCLDASSPDDESGPRVVSVPRGVSSPRGVSVPRSVSSQRGVSDSFDRAGVIQSRCRDSESQEFRIRYVGGGQSQIRTFAGRCLDVSSPDDESGPRGMPGRPGASGSFDRGRIIQSRCQDSDSQEFQIG